MNFVRLLSCLKRLPSSSMVMQSGAQSRAQSGAILILAPSVLSFVLSFVLPSTALATPANACAVRALPLSQVQLAAKPTELKLEMTSTSRRTQVTHAAFHLLGEGDTEVLELFGIGFHINGRTLAYACINIDEATPSDDRIEILFHSVNSQGLVHSSPLQITWKPLQPAHVILGGIFDSIPLIGPALGAINDAIHTVAGSFEDHLHKAVNAFSATGVDRVVITRDGIELSFGISVLGGALHGPHSAELTPMIYKIPLVTYAE